MRILIGTSLLLGAATLAAGGEIRVPGDQPTIQAAVDAAAEGDVIVCGPGVYAEAVVAAKSNLTIVGRGATWDGGTGEEAGTCLDLAGDGNAVVGFRFENGTDQVLLAGSGVSVSSCTSADAGGSFVRISGDGAVVAKCSVSGAGGDAVVVAGAGAEISKVRVSACGGAGIAVTGDDALLEKCRVDDSGGDGYLVEGGAAVIVKSRATDCGDGDDAGFHVVGADASLEKNLALRCDSDGFRIEGDSGVLVKNRAFDSGDDGIDVEAGVAVEVRSCTSLRNDGGGIENGGAGTVVLRSRFLRNGTDVALDGSLDAAFGGFERNVFATGSTEATLGL